MKTSFGGGEDVDESISLPPQPEADFRVDVAMMTLDLASCRLLLILAAPFRPAGNGGDNPRQFFKAVSCRMHAHHSENHAPPRRDIGHFRHAITRGENRPITIA